MCERDAYDVETRKKRNDDIDDRDLREISTVNLFGWKVTKKRR